MKDKALEKLSKNELLELMLYLRKEYDKIKKVSLTDLTGWSDR